MPTPNKMQIETAEQLLRKTLNKRRQEIGNAAFEKDIKKYTKSIIALNKEAYELYKKIAALKLQVEKNPNLTYNIDNYTSYAGKLPKTLQEAEDNSDAFLGAFLKPKTHYVSGHHGYQSQYEPDMSKEEAAVEKFILELKLGTALMTDLQTLVDMINKRK